MELLFGYCCHKENFQGLQKSVLLVNSFGVLSTLFRKTCSCLCREVCMEILLPSGYGKIIQFLSPQQYVSFF